MNLQDWMELGYSKKEAKQLVFLAAEEVQYENNAHKAFYSQNL
tara:strand:+ start:105 stop:233 length:129 start_codon:yes stop_codon:yes gene_type:complete